MGWTTQDTLDSTGGPTAMRNAFLDHLLACDVLAESQMAELRQLLRGAPEPIGAIAFRYGLIAGGDIDLVLDHQRCSHKPFGEIAMELGLLSREQVVSLLDVQQLRAATESAEALVLAGICTMEEMISQLGAFLGSEQKRVVGGI